MKRIVIIMVLVVLALVLCQCRKKIDTISPADNAVKGVRITIDLGSKHEVLPMEEGGYVNYKTGDVIYVGYNGKYVGTVTCESDGKFRGNVAINTLLPEDDPNNYLHFYFIGGKTPSVAPTAGITTSFTVDISDQSVNLPVLSYARANQKYVDGVTEYTCTLRNLCGLVKFTPQYPTLKAIIVRGMMTKATVAFANDSITPTDSIGDITLYSENGTAKWAILLPHGAIEDSVAVAIQGYTKCAIPSGVPAVENNAYLIDGVAIQMTPTGIVDGKFTVDSTGKQVYFSQGNLQYIGSAATPYWKFADNQWDIIGNSQGAGNSPKKDRDLFGWCTSGFQQMPYLRDTANTHYGNGCVDVNHTEYDWGVYNPISGAGNASNMWRTLTIEEWTYLLRKRADKGYESYAKATVNDNKGLIILPDGWKNGKFYSLNKINVNEKADFSDNVISMEDWASKLEAHGVVFLPAGGIIQYNQSSGKWNNTSQNSNGYYWTISCTSNAEEAHVMYFISSKYFLSGLVRRDGCSVRLVTDVK